MAQQRPVRMLQRVYTDWGQSVEGSAVCNPSGTATATTHEVLLTEVLRAGFMLQFSKSGQESCSSSIWYEIANRNVVQGKDRPSSALQDSILW